MSDISGTYQRASVLDAARILGVSPTTVRRMVRDGTLQAERVLRPQGHTFVVLVPTDSQPAASSSQQVSATARTEQPQADAMVSLIQTTIATVLGPLVGQLDAQRQTIERQADRVAELTETIGELRATVGQLREQNATLSAPGATNTTPTSPAVDTSPAWLSARLWPALALVVVAVLGLAVLLGR